MAQPKAPSTGGLEASPVEDVAGAFSMKSQHLRLTQVLLADGSDHRNELVQEREWLLHPSERNLSLQGNLFAVEDMADRSGRILVKRAPLPGARPTPLECDLRVTPGKGGGFDFARMGAKGAATDDWVVLEYEGGRLGRTKALHEWQRDLRPRTRNHACPHLLVNTWGDRSRDTRMRDDFIESEIDAVARLGGDVLQLDDGWQRGTTMNSAYAKERGGVWEGFWNADPRFWDPHPDRFRNGLESIVTRAREKGVRIGLWFSPDSWNDFASWRRDADRILELVATLGIHHFKIDGVKAPTAPALDNLANFFQTVLKGSRGEVVFDLDITAGIRPGYFGAIEIGPLFVENRYTDWHNYWPHQTLRNLWKLSRWIDPRRLRMEFLNNARNLEKYPDDPLAPAGYDPATLFATVMCCNPLGWFEASNLTGSYMEKVSALVKTWKAHREDLFAGTILPVGDDPDGYSSTGFLSLSDDMRRGYLLAFRELHPRDRAVLRVPGIGWDGCEWEVLASVGDVDSREDALEVRIPERLGFLFARFRRK